MLLKIQHAYSVHQSFIKFAHVVCSPFWIRLWKNYAPVRPCTQDQCFYFACTLMARRVMIECSYPHPYARPSSFTYNKILERQSAVHKRLFKKKKHCMGQASASAQKEDTPSQQIFVLHVYCGPFLCGWQLSTSWQIPIVAAAASWPVSEETKEADHVIFCTALSIRKANLQSWRNKEVENRKQGHARGSLLEGLLTYSSSGDEMCIPLLLNASLQEIPRQIP
jgi:hypothetical protein